MVPDQKGRSACDSALPRPRQHKDIKKTRNKPPAGLRPARPRSWMDGTEREGGIESGWAGNRYVPSPTCPVYRHLGAGGVRRLGRGRAPQRFANERDERVGNGKRTHKFCTVRQPNRAFCSGSGYFLHAVSLIGSGRLREQEKKTQEKNRRQMSRRSSQKKQWKTNAQALATAHSNNSSSTATPSIRRREGPGFWGEGVSDLQTQPFPGPPRRLCFSEWVRQALKMFKMKQPTKRPG
jgi:hypothetical protein